MRPTPYTDPIANLPLFTPYVRTFYRATAALRELVGEKLLELMGIKILVPKKELPTSLRWNLPVFVAKPDLHNGLGVAL